MKSDTYNEIVEKYRIKGTKNNLRNDPFNLRVEVSFPENVTICRKLYSFGCLS